MDTDEATSHRDSGARHIVASHAENEKVSRDLTKALWQA